MLPEGKRDLRNVHEDLKILEEGRRTGRRRVEVPEALFGEIALKIAI